MKFSQRLRISDTMAALFFYVVVALIVFHRLLSPGAILFSTDGNIGAVAWTKSVLPAAFLSAWNDSLLAGVPAFFNLSSTTLLQLLVPADFSVSWAYAIHMTFSAVFLFLFLRDRGCRPGAAIAGGLTAYWLGSNMTLLYPGHLGKFGVMTLATAALWCIERAARTRRIPWALLAGGALGLMFAEQQDVALFCAAFLVPYAIYAVAREVGGRPNPTHDTRRFDIAGVLRIGLPMAVVMVAVAAHPLLIGYRTAVKDITQVSTESAAAKWEYLTQWSWPPEECIDFIAPGYMGWRSGEPSGPYWGRMGQSPGWSPQNQAGFRNFKLESQYLGVLPVALVFWGLWSLLGGTRRPNTPDDDGGAHPYPAYTMTRRADTLCWAIITLVALVLAFGKFTPLYRLVAALPGFSSIRNPNKFLHIFQLGIGVLTAFGLDHLLTLTAHAPAPIIARLKRFLIGLALCAGLLLAGWVALVAGAETTIAKLTTDGWGDAAGVIQSNRIQALGHALVMTLLTAGLFLIVWRQANGRTWPWGGAQGFTRTLPVVCIVLLIGDACLLARHYVTLMPPSLVEENDVSRFLKTRRGHERTALVSQEGPYNAWLTFLFPYHNIPCVNFTQMPRMPEPYRNFMDAVGAEPLRYWQLMGVRYVLAPSEIIHELEKNPALRAALQPAFAFNFSQTLDGGFTAYGAAPQRQSRQIILELTVPSRRFALIAHPEFVDPADIFKRLSAPDFQPLQTILLPVGARDTFSPTPDASAQGSIQVTSYRAGRIQLAVQTTGPCILRAAEYYTPHWRATIDGQSAPLSSCDGIFLAVPLPQGTHTVTLLHQPPAETFWLQVGAMILCLWAALRLAKQRAF